MGSSNSKDQIQKINHAEWMNLKIEDGTEIVRSNKGNGEAQIRLIGLDPKHEVQKQKSIYSYRKNTNLPLVKALGAQFSQSQNKTLCGNQQNVKVLTERIPYKLQNIRNLNFHQSLYVLSESLAGFNDLYNKAGVFDINNKMIGFNTNGETKVWLNQNFAQNHPISQRPILQTTLTTPQIHKPGMTSQQRMVQSIIHEVQNKCQNKKQFAEFNKTLETKTKTFEQAYNCIEEYIKVKNIHVPDKIDFNTQLMTQNNELRVEGEDYRNTVTSRSVDQTTYNHNVGINRNTINIGQIYTRSIPQPVYTTTTPRIITNTTIQPPSSSTRIYHSPQPHSPRVYTNPTTVTFGNNSAYYTGAQNYEPYTYGIITRPLSPKFASSATTRPISFNYQSPNPQTIKN